MATTQQAEFNRATRSVVQSIVTLGASEAAGDGLRAAATAVREAIALEVRTSAPAGLNRSEVSLRGHRLLDDEALTVRTQGNFLGNARTFASARPYADVDADLNADEMPDYAPTSATRRQERLFKGLVDAHETSEALGLFHVDPLVDADYGAIPETAAAIEAFRADLVSRDMARLLSKRRIQASGAPVVAPVALTLPTAQILSSEQAAASTRLPASSGLLDDGYVDTNTSNRLLRVAQKVTVVAGDVASPSPHPLSNASKSATLLLTQLFSPQAAPIFDAAQLLGVNYLRLVPDREHASFVTSNTCRAVCISLIPLLYSDRLKTEFAFMHYMRYLGYLAVRWLHRLVVGPANESLVQLIECATRTDAATRAFYERHLRTMTDTTTAHMWKREALTPLLDSSSRAAIDGNGDKDKFELFEITVYACEDDMRALTTLRQATPLSELPPPLPLNAETPPAWGVLTIHQVLIHKEEDEVRIIGLARDDRADNGVEQSALRRFSLEFEVAPLLFPPTQTNLFTKLKAFCFVPL